MLITAIPWRIAILRWNSSTCGSPPSGTTDKPDLPSQPYAGPDPSLAYKHSRSVYIPSAKAYQEVPVYDGFALTYGMPWPAPASLSRSTPLRLSRPSSARSSTGPGTYTIYIKENEADVLARVLKDVEAA